MVFAAKAPGFFDADDINGPLHHTNQGVLTVRVGTDAARNLLGEGAADRADANPLANLRKGLGKLADFGGITLDQRKGHPLGGTQPQPPQPYYGGSRLQYSFRPSGH